MKTQTALRAAIYARKSTDDSGKNEENRSTTRQIDRGREFAKKQGWRVDPAHIYVDDNVSGAEFENRPGFSRLLAALPKRQRAPFDVLIVSEVSRLGRDQQRTMFYLAHIRDAGVQIWCYLNGEEERADSPEAVLMTTLRAYAAEVERAKAGQRARDALTRKAANGFNAGGRVFGYDNHEVMTERDGRKVRDHTEYRINPTEADVLRRLFTMYAAGHGLQTVAKTMNGDPRYASLFARYFDCVRPAAPRKGTGSWAASSIHSMLHNERYTGMVPYGAFRKAYRHGAPVRVQGEVVKTQAPKLRVIPDELWRAVQVQLEAARVKYVKDTNGRLFGRPDAVRESKYLLSGFGECGCCGRNITVLGGNKEYYYYGCGVHQYRGSTICANDYKSSMREADALVLATIRERVLTPAAIDYTVEKALALLKEKRRERTTLPTQLDTEARRMKTELDRFLRLVADGSAPQSVKDEILRRETRLRQIAGERAALNCKEPTAFEVRRLRALLRERLAKFDALLLSDVPMARAALRRLIVGRIEFRPETGARRYKLRWKMTTAALLSEGYIRVASPGGFEPPYSP